MVVKATYIDENTGATKVRTITNYTFSPENFTTTGQQQVTISYTHDGVTKTAQVTVNVSAPAEYTISVTNTNGTYTGDTIIIQKQTASVTLIADSNYKLPATITVTGAEYEYNRSTGVITLSNPTSNVEITAECTAGEYFAIVLNGDKNWAFNTSGEPNGNGFYNCYLIDSTIVPAKNLVDLNGVYGSDVSCSDSRFVMVNEQRTETNKLGLGYFGNDPSLYFRFDSSIATSVEEFKAWLAENPVAVYIQKI